MDGILRREPRNRLGVGSLASPLFPAMHNAERPRQSRRQRIPIVSVDPETLHAGGVFAGQLKAQQDLANARLPFAGAHVLGFALRRAGDHGNLAPGLAIVGADRNPSAVFLASGPDLSTETQTDQI